MPINLKKTDVVLIGIGASGGVAALELAKAGIDVIAIEAGQRLSANDFPSDEIRMNIRGWLGRVKVNNEVPTGRLTSAQTATRPLGATGPMMNGVGGTSIHYATQSWRHEAYEYKVRSTNLNRYGAGSIPAGSTVTDWPLTAAELEPYHDEIEYLLGVSGKAGNIKGKKDERGNIFEASRRREYPLPPLRQTGYAAMLHDGRETARLPPVPRPRGDPVARVQGPARVPVLRVLLRQRLPRRREGLDVPERDPGGGEDEEAQGRDARPRDADQLRRRGPGHRRHVRQGRRPVLPARQRRPARDLHLREHAAAPAVASAAYPRGLSNNNGQVGKHYMSHNQSGVNVFAVYPQKLNRMTGTFAQGTGFDDFAGDNFDHTGLGFIGGGCVYSGSGQTPIAAARVSPPDVPRWGSAWKEWQQRTPTRRGSVYVQIAGIPYEANYLDLDPTVRDPQGYPVVRVTFNLYQNELSAITYLREKVIAWFNEAGATRTWTTAARRQPASARTRSAARAWATTRRRTSSTSGGSRTRRPTSAILGASTFPTSGGHNPTQQVQAMALRTARYLRRNWKSIAQ